MHIAILGGTSHLAKNLLVGLTKAGHQMTLFCRSATGMQAFLNAANIISANVHEDFNRIGENRYDLLINCVGAGTPTQLGGDFNRWFSLLEHFDNLSLDYLKNRNRECLYISFSSGAVYGRTHLTPCGDSSVWRVPPNHIAVTDYYGLVKLYSEAKHRSLPELRIVDLRIFSFFSRFATLDSGYFMTDLVSALLSGTVFKTSPGEMLRDYPHPSDLLRLIIRCTTMNRINTAIDVASAAPVSKNEILRYFTGKFGLRYEIAETNASVSPNGNANVYYPDGTGMKLFCGAAPEYTSMQTLDAETAAIICEREK